MDISIFPVKNKGHLYASRSPYDKGLVAFYRQLKSEFGSSNLYYSNGYWYFSDIGIVDRIRQRYPQAKVDPSVYETSLVEKKIKESFDGAKDRIKRIKSKDGSDLVVKNIKLDLYPFQRVGVEFFEATNGRALLADQMGTGKTAQTLSYVAHSSLSKVIIVCPASVKFSWDGEVGKWTYLKSCFIESSDTEQDIFNMFCQDLNIYIMSYNAMAKHADTLASLAWDLVVFDESHMLKSQTAQRTKCAKKLSQKIEKLILLSGTPMLNRPVELFTSLNMLDPMTWKNWKAYTARYCGGRMGYFGWEAKGATNIQELRDRIDHHYLRRTKDDVLKQLPEKVFTDIPVEMGEKDWKEYNKIKASEIKLLKEVRENESKQFAYLAVLQKLRQFTTDIKQRVAKDMIADIVENGEKVIVFSAYNAPLRWLHSECFSDISVIITGDTKQELRGEAVRKFQNEESCRVFFGGIQSAGVGITLTAASTVLFIDYDWTPALMDQAVDRAHRPGATAESINVYQLYIPDTIDEYMKEVLNKKSTVFRQVIDDGDGDVMQSNIFKHIINRLEKYETFKPRRNSKK